MPRGSQPGERRGGRQKGTPNMVTAAVRRWVADNVDPAGNLARIARGEAFACNDGLQRIVPNLDQIILANRILLDKMVPSAKAERMALGLPEVKSAADIPAFGRAVIKAVSDGILGCDEAQRLVQVAAALEPSELVQEVERLKAMVAALVTGNGRASAS